MSLIRKPQMFTLTKNR